MSKYIEGHEVLLSSKQINTKPFVEVSLLDKSNIVFGDAPIVNDRKTFGPDEWHDVMVVTKAWLFGMEL